MLCTPSALLLRCSSSTRLLVFSGSFVVVADDTPSRSVLAYRRARRRVLGARRWRRRRVAIELVTGTPGAGKTAYAVGVRMQAEQGRKLRYQDHLDVWHEATRTIYAGGFNRLLVEHERLGHPLTGETTRQADIDRWNKLNEDGQPVMQRRPGEPAWTHEPDGRPIERTLFNWWLWCSPGDLIAYDEVQYVVPRGSMPRVAPWWVRAMETHRHYGIDFLLITQHPQLLDTPFRALVNPHRHVRSVGILPSSLGLCVLYVWDHASNPERFSTAHKQYYRRRRSYFALYKSTVAVMAQPSAGRGYVIAGPILLAGAAFLGWKAIHGYGSSSAVAAPAPASSSALRPVAGQAVPRPRNPPGWDSVPKLSGCYSVGARCTCMDQDGLPVAIEQTMCKISAASYSGLVRWERRAAPPAATTYGAAAAGVIPASAPSSRPHPL